jgi:hypothetical protein
MMLQIFYFETTIVSALFYETIIRYRLQRKMIKSSQLQFFVCTAGSRYIGGISIHKYTVYYIKRFFICDDYVAEVRLCHFLENSSCVWPMLAADALWRVVCSFF